MFEIWGEEGNCFVIKPVEWCPLFFSKQFSNPQPTIDFPYLTFSVRQKKYTTLKKKRKGGTEGGPRGQEVGTEEPSHGLLSNMKVGPTKESTNYNTLGNKIKKIVRKSSSKRKKWKQKKIGWGINVNIYIYIYIIFFKKSHIFFKKK